MDILFYLNTFVWTYDPREKPFHKLPFVTWEYQDDAIKELVRAMGVEDVFIDKSRDMGASWLCLAVLEWYWHFRPLQSFLVISRTEDYVDKSGNPKSLFWKLDFIHRNQPKWLLPVGFDREKHRNKNHLLNPETRSVIDGESTTEDIARGDRRTAIMLDEFAAIKDGFGVLGATRDATNCRIFNSTPKGVGNAHHSMLTTCSRRIRLHWSEHPIKGRGLYTTENNELKKLDTKYPFRKEYPFILDTKLRSPWYDKQCERAATPQEIAQELDIDYLGSGYCFFDKDMIERLIVSYTRPPMKTGTFDFEAPTAEPLGWQEDERGRFDLWLHLDAQNNFPLDRNYVVGCDASAGTGASNSALSVWDSHTREKVASYVDPYIRPERFASFAVAVARWVGGAFLIWETNGSGRQFGDRVMELHYSHIYYRRAEHSIRKKSSDIPGWAPTRDNKKALLGEYGRALAGSDCMNPDKDSLRECQEYYYQPSGAIEHSSESGATDPSGAKDQHGDRVIADALCWLAMKSEKPREVQLTLTPPVGSFAWRRKIRTKQEERSRETDFVFS